MANEMTTSKTHAKAQDILTWELEELVVDRTTLRSRDESEAESYIEETLDQIIGEWDLARAEVEGEANLTQEALSAAQSRIAELEAELEEVKAQRDSAEAKVDRLSGRED